MNRRIAALTAVLALAAVAVVGCRHETGPRDEVVTATYTTDVPAVRP